MGTLNKHLKQAKQAKQQKDMENKKIFIEMMNKYFMASENTFNDITHSNGDKEYQTITGEYIFLEKEAAILLDRILDKNYTGWGYMPELISLKDNGKITQKQFEKMVSILD